MFKYMLNEKLNQIEQFLLGDENEESNYHWG